MNTIVQETCYDKAVDFVEKAMDENSTIPEEMRDELIQEKFSEFWEEACERDIEDYGGEFYGEEGDL